MCRQSKDTPRGDEALESQKGSCGSWGKNTTSREFQHALNVGVGGDRDHPVGTGAGEVRHR